MVQSFFPANVKLDEKSLGSAACVGKKGWMIFFKIQHRTYHNQKGD
jgi:hypothetical protein